MRAHRNVGADVENLLECALELQTHDPDALRSLLSVARSLRLGTLRVRAALADKPTSQGPARRTPSMTK